MSMTPCDECENFGYIIVDTNFLILLLNYLHTQNPRIGIRAFCSNLRKILQGLTSCSINNQLYMSNKLFDNEINYFNNNRAALFRKTRKFYRDYRDKRNDIRQVLNVLRAFFNILTVDDGNLNLIEVIASSCFTRNPPDQNDLSLILIALYLSNSDSNRNISKIVSGDMKLGIFQEEHLSNLDHFDNLNGDSWLYDKIRIENRFDPIARVYSCCKLDSIEEYFNLYCEDVKSMLRDNIRFENSYDRKFDIFKEIAINKHIYESKKQLNIEAGICIE